MSTAELQAVRSLDLSNKERAEIAGEVVEELVTKYGVGNTVRITNVLHELSGFRSRVPAEIAEALDFGEALGRLEINSSNRTITIKR